MEKERKKPSLLSFAIVTVVIIAILYYLVIAMNTGDLQWFRSDFNGQPQQIVLHCYGQDVVVSPTDAQYFALNQLVNDALSGRKRWDPLSLSDVTYAEYQDNQDWVVLELSYAPPMRVHSNTKYFSQVDTLIIPLIGRHAQYNTVFGRNQGNINAGSFHLDSIEAIKGFLEAQELCVES